MYSSELVNEDFLIRVAVLASKYMLNINQPDKFGSTFYSDRCQREEESYSNGSVSIVRYKYGIEI